MRSTRTVVLQGVLVWALAIGGLRAIVAQPEHCGDPTSDDLRAAADAAVGWFVGNQRDDGSWLYRYDRDLDTDVGGYNITRHAGVTMSLEQAASAGIPESSAAGESARRGIDWALDNLQHGPGWAALATAEAPRIGTGASALLTAALVIRRERTEDDELDAVIHDLGAFLVASVNDRGQVYGYWDPETQQPIPESWSRYFTGEVFWALTLLHRVFPEGGYDEPALRIAEYIAIERNDVENYFPELPDHWAAYGFATMTTWPAGGELTDEHLAYARRQAGIMGAQIRYESQRTNSWFSHHTRGRQTLGAGLGTIGEALSNWAVVAEDPTLADLRDPIVERARCVAGAAVDRQVGPEDLAVDDDPGAVLGAWFQFDVTQMDDQQHVLSALLGALELTQP